MKRAGSPSSIWGFARLASMLVVLLVGALAAPIGVSAVGEVESASFGFAPGQTAFVADGPLNVRSGPGTGYIVLEVLWTGEYVEIVSGPTSANGYQWYEVLVDYSGTYGFVAGIFLAPVSGGGFSIGDTVYVDSDVLNVRSGPGTGYSIIDVMTFGQNGLILDGPVFANGYTWYQLTYVGGTVDGWVAGEYLGLVSTGGFDIGDTVSVVTDALNVRSGPGLGYIVIDLLTYGDQGIVIDGPYSADGYYWYQLSYAGGAYTGWVASDYLAYVSAGSFVIGDSVYVTAGVLNVRSGAGTGYSIIDYLSYGTTAKIVGGPYVANGYTWYQIQYSGSYNGWVAGEYLALT